MHPFEYFQRILKQTPNEYLLVLVDQADIGFVAGMIRREQGRIVMGLFFESFELPHQFKQGILFETETDQPVDPPHHFKTDLIRNKQVHVHHMQLHSSVQRFKAFMRGKSKESDNQGIEQQVTGPAGFGQPVQQGGLQILEPGLGMECVIEQSPP